ncbi:inorganic diphosphatase [Sandaracinobacteroides saxicola]|uniref:Inorganic pyrophosphatase n=1 Tax=Sandaracinobacteroides saxicola TaxID=2759707 RepID=A0A7G5IJE2_9SPHN|nr:inorganic diphosphatase [Sandaracinobacteroides saxicola]QMW23484.1 inorganic diphosphatase [Sandaracinobacteroides saxicola]
MRIDAVPIGKNPPQDVNVIIECPLGGEPVKYELDKASGALFVDRIVHTSMRYPTNYGFIPHTLAEDGDPIDALIVSRTPFIPGCIARARPVGVMMMEDDAGGDAKLLCVPVDKLFPYYTNVNNYTDLPAILISQIEHFFKHYKDLEPGKWVKFNGWRDRDVAERLILEAIERASQAARGEVYVKPKLHEGAPA